MSRLTAKQQSFIDLMKANDELALKGFQLLLHRDDYPQFFDSLQEAGFFAPASNPAPIPVEQDNTIRIPYWPPLDYLKDVAKHAGTKNDVPLAVKVIDVVREVSLWRDEKGEPRRNYRTNGTFAEILGLIPSIVVTLSDIDLLREWLNDPYEHLLIAVALDKVVLSRFLSSTDPADWEKAARVLYHVTAITWRAGGDEREPTPSSVVDDFWLGELIKNRAKQIGARAGEKAANTMLERVREVFSTPLRRDHSSVFRPAVEDDSQNYAWRSVENRVVDGLRDGVLGWADTDPKNAYAVIQRMLNDDLQMIRRVGIYLLAQHWSSMRNLYTGIVGTGLFDNGHSHELYHLLRDHFADMSSAQQAATVKAIEMLPDPTYGDDPRRLRRHSQYRWLSAIKGKGSALADERYAELQADPTVGELNDHPDFDSYITSHVGPGATPYPPEELMALAKANVLVEKLNKFAPGDDWHGPTTDGLTSALETAARANPVLFLDSLSQHLVAKPIYQHAVINGLKQAWEAKTDANWVRGWEQLVSFFEQLLNDEHFWQQKDMYQHWVVGLVADCLRAGTATDEHAYDPSLLPRTQLIIARLLDNEPGVDTPADDAMFEAMNTWRGRIIEALYSQALRAARVNDKKQEGHQEAWSMIRPLFEKELALCKNANYEFSTHTGNYLPQLQYLDSTWTNERMGQIFPLEYEANTVCALDGLAYASFTRQVYELLSAHGVIERALSLELKGRSAREKLLERIGAAYLWGLEDLDSPCLRKLFETAKVSDLNVVTHIFWVVRNENLEPEKRERILAFWECSLEWAQHQQQLPARLISMLSLLATHITAIGPRERHLLEAVAPHVNVGHESYEFVAELLRLAPQDPAAILNVLQLMIATYIPQYDYQDRLRSLLEFLAEHGQREAVILISDRLRHLHGVETLFKSLIQH